MTQLFIWFALTAASEQAVIKIQDTACGPEAVVVLAGQGQERVLRARGSGCRFVFDIAPAALRSGWLRAAPCGLVQVPASWNGEPLPCPRQASLVLPLSLPAERPRLEKLTVSRRPAHERLQGVGGSLLPEKIPSALFAEEVPPGRLVLHGFPVDRSYLYDVGLVFSGFAAAVVRNLRFAEPTVTRHLVLEPAGRLCGRVVPYGGRPKGEHLKVAVERDGQRLETVTVDSEGRFCVPDLPAGPPLRVWALSEFGEGDPVMVSVSGEEVEVPMPPVIEVVLDATDADTGEPVAAFSVTVEVALGGSRLFGGQVPGGRLTDRWPEVVRRLRVPGPLAVPNSRFSGKEGRVHFPRPWPVLPLMVTVEAEGYVTRVVEVPPDVSRVEVPLRKPRWLRGSVVFAESGSLAPHVTVVARCEGGEEVVRATDAQGMVELPLPYGVACTVTVRHPGFCAQPHRWDGRSTEPFSLLLSAGEPVSGVVVEFGSHKPVASARVEGQQEGSSVTATTDSQGRFSLAGFCPGVISLQVTREGFAGASQFLATRDPVTVVLKRTRPRRGRVLGLAENQPARVFFGSPGGLQVAEVDSEGWFDLPEGLVGKHQWMVRGPNLGTCAGELDAEEEGEITLDCRPWGFEVRGRLLSVSGSPPGVLLLRPPASAGARTYRAEVLPDHSFVFPQVAPGPYELLVFFGNSTGGKRLWHGLVDRNLNLELVFPPS